MTVKKKSYEQLNKNKNMNLKNVDFNKIPSLSKEILEKLNKLGTLKFEQKLSQDKTLFLPFFKEDTLIKSGKIRKIGLSNENPWGIMKFLEYSKKKSSKNGYNTKSIFTFK